MMGRVSGKSVAEKKAADAARKRAARQKKKIQAAEAKANQNAARNRQQEIKEQESKLRLIKESHAAFNMPTTYSCDDHDFPLQEIPKPLPETLALWNRWLQKKISVMQDVDEAFQKYPKYRAPQYIPGFLKSKLHSGSHARYWEHKFWIAMKEFDETKRNEIDETLQAFWEDPHERQLAPPIQYDCDGCQAYIESEWEDIIMEAAKEDGCSQEVKHLAYQVQFIRNEETAALLRVWDAKQNDPHRGSAWLYDSFPDLSMWQEEQWDNWKIEEEREVLALVKQGHTKILQSWSLSAYQRQLFEEDVAAKAQLDAMDTSNDSDSDSDSDDDEDDDRFRK